MLWGCCGAVRGPTPGLNIQFYLPPRTLHSPFIMDAVLEVILDVGGSLVMYSTAHYLLTSSLYTPQYLRSLHHLQNLANPEVEMWQLPHGSHPPSKPCLFVACQTENSSKGGIPYGAGGGLPPPQPALIYGHKIIQD